MISLKNTNAQVNSPGVNWSRSDRIHFYPQQISIPPNYPTDYIAEDWWYDHKNSYDGGIIDPDYFNGFVTCGYSDIRNVTFSEQNDGCYSTSTYSPSFCSEDLPYPYPNFPDINGVTSNVSFQTVAKYDQFGNLLWFNSYNTRWFIKIIQTSDGNYVAIGPSRSTRQPDTNNPIFYNPKSAVDEDAFGLNGNYCNTVDKINVVKIDPDGNIIWNYLFGVAAITDPNVSTDVYQPLDIVEYAINSTSPKLRIVGFMEPTGVSYHKSLMLDLDKNTGFMNWIETYNPSSTSGDFFRHPVAIEKHTTSSGEFLATSGVDGESTNAGRLLNVTYYNASSTPPITPIWDVYHNLSTSSGTTHHASYDLCFDGNGDLLVPVLYNCNNCLFPKSVAEAAVLRLNKTNGNILAQYQISNGTSASALATAYDLKIGITNTSDGGFAIVTSKTPLDYDTRYGGANWTCDGTTYYTSNMPHFASCAFVRKFDTSGNVQWSKNWDIDDLNPEPYPKDFRKAECLYSITETPDGGLVIAGNNSRNFDDCYLAKLYDNCNNEQTYDFETEAADGLIEVSEIYALLGKTELSTSYKIKGSIVIHDQEELTITGTNTIIEFADTRKSDRITKIVVESGGRLIINDGAKLTSIIACPNSMWDGIQVEGDNSTTQNTSYAALELDQDATIENARVAVLADRGYYILQEKNPGPNQAIIKRKVLKGYHTHGGAYITATSTNFYNNRFGILFHSYPGFDNSSYVQSCRFLLDQPINDFDAVNRNGERTGINTFIVMYDVHGIIIDNNEFDISYSFSSIKDHGLGVGAFDSEFQLTSNEFNGLLVGLAAGATNTLNSFNAKCNQFLGVVQGMDIRGIDFPIITGNQMSIVNGPNPYGIYIEESTGYKIENNNLYFTVTSSGTTAGIVNYFPSQNPYLNIISLNNIFDFSHPLILEGYHHRNLTSNDGTQLICNELKGYEYAISVTVPPGIAGFQGQGNGANNMFDSYACNLSEGELYNPSGMNPFTYFHKLNSTDGYVEPVNGCYTGSSQVIPDPYTLAFSRSGDCMDQAWDCSPQFSNKHPMHVVIPNNSLRTSRDSTVINDPDLFFNAAMQRFLHDKTIVNPMDSIIHLLEANRTLSGHLLANAYEKVGRRNSLTTELASLNIDPTYMNFTSFRNLLSGSSRIDLLQDTVKKSSLYRLAMDTTTYGSAAARNLIAQLYDDSFDPVIIYPAYTSRVQRVKENKYLNILVYPNPVTSTLNIQIPEVDNIYRLQLFNILGVQLMDKVIHGDPVVKIDFRNYTSGLYMINISSNNELVYSTKVNHIQE